MVDIRGVSYAANGARILDDVSVQFRARRLNVILGPNGAGKSTLLKVATGLLRPTAGEVRYAGRPLGTFDSESLARMRAVLSQHVDLAFPLPVHEVVLMGRYPHYGRVPTARDREIVERALALVGMVEKREQPYPTLSGGEQQKVHLARVLAQIWNVDDPAEPRYLFLDEPTANLDVHYQIHLLDVVRSLLDSECTIVAVLHDLNVAFHYGDSFLLLDRGRVACRTDDALEIPGALLERVFRVRAHRVTDPVSSEGFWRFTL